MNKNEKEEFARRVQTYNRLNRSQYFVVTFDLSNSQGRGGTYRKFGNRLVKLLGSENVVKRMKQVYFVKSIYHRRDLRKELELVLNVDYSIVVVRLQSGHSYRLQGQNENIPLREFFSDLKENGG